MAPEVGAPFPLLDDDVFRDEKGTIGRVIDGNRVAIDALATIPAQSIKMSLDSARAAPDFAGNNQGKP